MDRNLALEFVRVTEAGAIAAARWVGSGDKNAADQAAVDEMRARLNQIDFRAKVVIGEGEKDEAPMLYTGETVGKGQGDEFDLAIDPLEGTDSVAYGRPNALSIIATGAKGSLMSAPDTYMEKIAVGPEARDVIDLDAPVKINIEKTARALGKKIENLIVVILERDRHKELIEEVRNAGARAVLIPDGDVEPAIAACLPHRQVDMLMGIGASTEAVLAAVAVKILGGEMLARFKPKDDIHRERLERAGITDLSRIYRVEDLAKGEMLAFTATGITDGPLLQGVKFSAQGRSALGGDGSIITDSVVMRAASGTIRYINTHHHAAK